MAVPCVLLTGFLGSGKTTFLNWLLKNHPDIKISVILNEFGDISLESQFINQKNESVIELANGCMCCVAKADLPRVIKYILTSSPDTQYILIEASGLSDPDPIHDAFTHPSLSNLVYLSQIICIVDAINFLTNIRDHKIITAQISDSDLIIISKISLSNTENILNVKGYFSSNLPNTKVLEWNETLNPEEFLVSNPKQSESEDESGHEHVHEHETYQNNWIINKNKYSREKISEIYSKLPIEIIRSKGYFVESDGSKTLIQFSNGKLELISSQWQAGEDSKTTILFMGKNFDASQLTSLFS